MKTTNKNPLAIKSERIDNLDRAFAKLMDSLDEFREVESLNQEQVEELKRLLRNAYIHKKLNYVFDYKMNTLNHQLSLLLESAAREKEGNTPFTKLLYMKQTKELMSNEQY